MGLSLFYWGEGRKSRAGVMTGLMRIAENLSKESLT